MTHLRIKQDNGIIEQVSPSVIEKLYEIVHSGNLDSCDLMGSLNTTSTYLDYVDYLEELFTKNGVRLLIITATKKYIMFADPVVLLYWANSVYGDGTGIDSTSAASVLNIPAAAFNNNTSIESFDELGKFTNCDTIKTNAFKGCSNLKSIDLNNIIRLEENSFKGCSSLGSINNGILNIPKLSTLQGNDLFLDCTSLVELNIGLLVQDINKITLLGYNVFEGCTNLEKITGLNMVLEIFPACFINCTKLESIDITSNLTSLQGYCFKNCSSLKCINLSGVTTLDSYSLFEGCTDLIDLATSDPTLINTGAATYTFNWSTIPLGMFVNCNLNNKSFSFPNATSIGQLAFMNTNIVAISIPNATSIGNSSIRHTGIVNVNIPEATSVGDWSFCECGELKSVISDELKTIGNYAFSNCSKLKCIDLTNVTSLGMYAFDNCSDLSDLSTGDETQVNLNTATYTLNTLTIPLRCFYNTNLLNKTINLPEATTIGEYAFYQSKIVGITIPEITRLEKYSLCKTNIQNITFGSNPVQLDRGCLEECSLLNTVSFNINSTVTTEHYCFKSCTNLSTINNISALKRIGIHTFHSCTSLGNNLILDLNLSEQGTLSMENAFYGTNYKGLILHIPLAIDGRWNYPAWEQMNSLEYLDLSDTHFGAFGLYVSTLAPLKTIILGETFSEINHKSVCEDRPSIQYLILLSPNVVGFVEPWGSERIFRSTWAPNLHIYVLNSTLVSEYLADSAWSNVENLSTHIHPLSELPAGVWTTGLASQYLTPALLATS